MKSTADRENRDSDRKCMEIYRCFYKDWPVVTWKLLILKVTIILWLQFWKE